MFQKCVRCGLNTSKAHSTMCSPCEQTIEIFTEARERLIAAFRGSLEVVNAIDCYIEAKRELLR